MLNKHPQEQYTWITLSFVAWWTPDQSLILCFGAPQQLQIGLESALKVDPSIKYDNPFALLNPVIDQILKLYDQSIWSIRDQIRNVESVRGEGNVWLAKTESPRIEPREHRILSPIFQGFMRFLDILFIQLRR
jgi:hypothetical protein